MSRKRLRVLFFDTMNISSSLIFILPYKSVDKFVWELTTNANITGLQLLYRNRMRVKILPFTLQHVISYTIKFVHANEFYLTKTFGMLKHIRKCTCALNCTVIAITLFTTESVLNNILKLRGTAQLKDFRSWKGVVIKFPLTFLLVPIRTSHYHPIRIIVKQDRFYCNVPNILTVNHCACSLYV